MDAKRAFHPIQWIEIGSCEVRDIYKDNEVPQ